MYSPNTAFFYLKAIILGCILETQGCYQLSVERQQYQHHSLSRDFVFRVSTVFLPKTVYAKDVRQALNYVESGNVDAGIVYLSDAKSSPQVKIVKTAPENTHKSVVYPIAVLKSSKNADAAKDFIQFVSNNQAKTAFENQGFTFATDSEK